METSLLKSPDYWQEHYNIVQKTKKQKIEQIHGSRTVSDHAIGFSLKLRFITRPVVRLVAQAAGTTVTLRVVT